MFRGMKSSMKTSLLLVFAALAAFSLPGASPTKPPSDPIIISLADVLPAHVQLKVLPDETSAHLIFYFARKTKRLVDAIVRKGSDGPVDIVDGPKLIGKAKQIVGTSEFTSGKKQKVYGLILTFDSVEEAERVAKAMQPVEKR